MRYSEPEVDFPTLPAWRSFVVRGRLRIVLGDPLRRALGHSPDRVPLRGHNLAHRKEFDLGHILEVCSCPASGPSISGSNEDPTSR